MNPDNQQKYETWETIDGTQTGVVIGAGVIADGKITVPEGTVIENANLRKVEQAAAPAVPVASTPLATPSVLNPPAPQPPQQPSKEIS